jgi:alpha-glucosidase (family GH31 glycosyl hydrolase)
MRYVPIIDAGLAYRTDGSYSAFTDGVNKNVFMTINGGKEIFIGQVWPSDAAYPDYFAANTSQWW